MKFTKKPITIEAIRWDGTTEGKMAVREFVHADKPLGLDGNVIAVLTNHGLADCNPGDWIICSPAGEYYPCSDEVMQATYDAVPEPQEAELVPMFEGTPETPGGDHAGFDGLAAPAPIDPDLLAARELSVAASFGHSMLAALDAMTADEEETTGEHKAVAPPDPDAFNHDGADDPE